MLDSPILALYGYPGGIRNWLASFESDDIEVTCIHRDIVHDGVMYDEKGQAWAKWKYGKGASVTAKVGQKLHYRDFVVDENNWTPVEDSGHA